MERLFPDRKNDGMFQNPGDESLYDFHEVMETEDSKKTLRDTVAYYPDGVEKDQKDFFVFISGLGQIAKESSKRSRRYADRLQVGVVNMNNASFLKEHPILKHLNNYMDWIDAFLDRIGISGSPVIEHAAQLIQYGVSKEVKIDLAADSHGTILVARAICRARRRFLMTHNFDEDLWEERTKNNINVIAFGNGYRTWPKGPNYVMVYITGDPLPERAGITPQRVEDRPDIYFLAFDAIFSKGSFEAHNMMFSIELLRTTFEKNNLAVGDASALLDKLQRGNYLIAHPQDVKWPLDIPEYTWDPASLDAIGFVKTRGSMNTDHPVVVGPSDDMISSILWTLFSVVAIALIRAKIVKRGSKFAC